MHLLHQRRLQQRRLQCLHRGNWCLLLEPLQTSHSRRSRPVNKVSDRDSLAFMDCCLGLCRADFEKAMSEESIVGVTPPCTSRFEGICLMVRGASVPVRA